MYIHSMKHLTEMKMIATYNNMDNITYIILSQRSQTQKSPERVIAVCRVTQTQAARSQDSETLGGQ